MNVLNSYIEDGFTIREAQPTPPAGPKRLRNLTGDQLMQQQFQPLNVVVDGLVTEGLGLLCSGPKLGKSFLCLDLAVAVTHGMPWLGHQTKPGSVLYAAYEDPARRLQDRLKRMGASVNSGCYFETLDNVITIDEGLISALDAFMDENQGITLVIIDTLAAIRGKLPRGTDIFQRDYQTIAELKKFADRRHVACVICHHTHKGAGRDSDILDMINGSTGLAAAADYIFLLERKRGEADGLLHIQHREYPSDKLELFFADEDCRWHLYDPGELLRKRYEAAPPVRVLKKALGDQVSAKIPYDDLKRQATEMGLFIGSTTNAIHKTFDAWSGDLARRDGIFISHKKLSGGKFGLDCTVIAPKGSR